MWTAAYFQLHFLKTKLFLTGYTVYLWCLGAKTYHHGQKPNMKNISHIFACNHTCMVDYAILSAKDYPLSIVPQKAQSGLASTNLTQIVKLDFLDRIFAKLCAQV